MGLLFVLSEEEKRRWWQVFEVNVTRSWWEKMNHGGSDLQHGWVCLGGA